MQTLPQKKLVGYIELEVGSLEVQVPIRAAEVESESGRSPLASFVTEGDAYAIVVRGDSSSAAVEGAVRVAAEEAVRHLSRKLLN